MGRCVSDGLAVVESRFTVASDVVHVCARGLWRAAPNTPWQASRGSYLNSTPQRALPSCLPHASPRHPPPLQLFPTSQQVVFDYTAYNESAATIDSSYRKGQPAQTQLGIQGLIPGGCWLLCTTAAEQLDLDLIHPSACHGAASRSGQ